MSFRLRLIISVSLLIAITFGIGGSALISASFNSSLQVEMQGALESFETIRNTLYLLNSLGEQTNFESLTNALSQMAEQNMVHWQALSLKSAEETIFQRSTLSFLDYQLPVPQSDQCSYLAVEDAYGHGVLMLSTISAGDVQLELKARFDVSNVYAARDLQQKMYLGIYICVVLLGIIVSTAFSFSMTRRLRNLTGTVRKIAGGDLSTRSAMHSQDEFGQLSRDFDVMADKLELNISQLQSEMQRQEAFMGAFAHELKTPMTSIIGYADLLRQGGLDDSMRMVAADYIFSEAQRLEKLSFKLLDLLLLKKDMPAMKEINLALLLQEVDRALAPVLRGKQIRLSCRAERGKVRLEPDLVKSLLYNLIDNAAKAVEQDGIVAVRASLIPGGCQIQVLDNGRGMEQEELTKITEAFYRVDKARSRKQGGAGLGLALCKEIVELHHGSIQFISAPGVGTRVTVMLYGSEDKGDA